MQPAHGRLARAVPGRRRRRASRSPKTLISAYHYGDLIHRGQQRDKLEVVKDDLFEERDAADELLDAAAGLSHLYMGFSLVARSALT